MATLIDKNGVECQATDANVEKLLEMGFRRAESHQAAEAEAPVKEAPKKTPAKKTAPAPKATPAPVADVDDEAGPFAGIEED